jgi:glycosyltransferase involved in cell wall biosynthesis
MVDAFLAIGTRNAEYYRFYGVPEDRIFHMPYAVDNAFFRRRAAEARLYREHLRANLGLSRERPVILFASKLQKRKRPWDLLEAYRRLSPDGNSEPIPYLLFVGDGEERERLQRAVRELGWSSVRFLGFVNQTELPAFYDLADVFVLPSEREPWGLVVNEVMNAAKPVIVSDQVGAAWDLVKEGENGFIVPVGDVETLADRIRRLTVDRALAERMGAASARRIAVWDFEADLAGLITALDHVVGR